MVPFGNHTVTLYHRVRDGTDPRAQERWTRHVLRGCSWKSKVMRSMAENAVLGTSYAICRIPPGQQMPAVGDVIVRGDVKKTVKSALDAAKLLASNRTGDAFRVTSVADNSTGGVPLPHIAARGNYED